MASAIMWTAANACLPFPPRPPPSPLTFPPHHLTSPLRRPHVRGSSAIKWAANACLPPIPCHLVSPLTSCLLPLPLPPFDGGLQVWHVPGSSAIKWAADAGSGVHVYHVFEVVDELGAPRVGDADGKQVPRWVPSVVCVWVRGLDI
jgi:hypothetical protein